MSDSISLRSSQPLFRPPVPLMKCAFAIGGACPLLQVLEQSDRLEGQKGRVVQLGMTAISASYMCIITIVCVSKA
eukprot:6190833-Pleurochrysis_carterae.AAC.2